MSSKTKYGILITVTALSILVLYFVPRISQNEAYHHFADTNFLMGVSNFSNVISNAPFLVVAVLGMARVRKAETNTVFEKVLLSGIFLTGMGSAWYHLSPNNNTLVWDRLPMTIVFMSFLSVMIRESIGIKTARAVFFPLLLVGITSVFYWQHTESVGRGDLRFYGWVQFFPMLFIVLILMLFPVKKAFLKELIFIILYYAAAKLAEKYDEEIFKAFRVMSGHSIKHLLAAGSTWHIVQAISKGKSS